MIAWLRLTFLCGRGRHDWDVLLYPKDEFGWMPVMPGVTIGSYGRRTCVQCGKVEVLTSQNKWISYQEWATTPIEREVTTHEKSNYEKALSAEKGDG